MKRTDRLTTITVAFLFIAMLCYIGLYAVQASANMTRTVYAASVSVRESASVSGIVLRNEHPLMCEMPYIQVTAQDGKRVAKGQAVAVSYGGKDALERAERIRALEAELEYAKAFMDRVSSAADVGSERAIRESVRELSALVMRHETANLDVRIRHLSSSVLGSDGVTYDDIDKMETELSSLKIMGVPGALPINASESGLFSTLLDGYEHLSLGSAAGITPSALRGFLDDKRPAPENTIGKLITSSSWYFAALMSEKDAARLTDFLAGSESSRVRLEFVGSTAVLADILSISGTVNGECAVVFACKTALADTLIMRIASAEVIFEEIYGLWVPKQAIHTDESGHTFVYVMTGPQAEAKTVEIMYEAEDFCILTPAVGADSLREGNEVIVDGKNIYDGKIIR